jgi:hypothetical protein
MRTFDDYPERRAAMGQSYRSSERIAHNVAAIATAVFWFLLGAGLSELL